MWKYLVMFVVILGFAVYIARQDKDAAQRNNAALSAASNKNHPEANPIYAEWSAPIWYGFFRWPYGTTTCAIILTLLAVAEQTKHTAKAAEATRESVGAITQQTKLLVDSVAAAQKSANAADISAKTAMGVAVPTLMLHKFEFLHDSEVRDDRAFLRYPKIKVMVKNFGQSPAFLKAWNFSFVWEEELPAKPVYDFPYPCDVEEVIEPGDTYTLDPETTQATSPTPDPVIDAVIARKKHLTVYGFVSYGDLFGSPIRYMKFCKRLYEFDLQRNYIGFMDHGGYEYTGHQEHYDAPNQKWPKPN